MLSIPSVECIQSVIRYISMILSDDTSVNSRIGSLDFFIVAAAAVYVVFGSDKIVGVIG